MPQGSQRAPAPPQGAAEVGKRAPLYPNGAKNGVACKGLLAGVRVRHLCRATTHPSCAGAQAALSRYTRDRHRRASRAWLLACAPKARAERARSLLVQLLEQVLRVVRAVVVDDLRRVQVVDLVDVVAHLRDQQLVPLDLLEP